MVYAIEQTSKPYIVEHGLWALSNLCRGNPMPKYSEIQSGLPVLAKKICQGWISDKQTLADCLWALAYNIKYSHERVQQLLLNIGFQRIIPKFLHDSEFSVVVPTVRILSNIVSNKDNLQIILKESDLMSALNKLLNIDKKIVRAQIC